MLPTNVGGLLQAAPLHMISPTLEVGGSFAAGRSLPANAIAGVVTALVVAGLVRQARVEEWKPIHLIMVFNAALMLVFNWPVADRYTLPFVPLFYVGLWLEGKYLVSFLLKSCRQNRQMGERLFAGIMLTGVVALLGLVLWNYGLGYRPHLLELARQRTLKARQKTQVYDWIRRNTPADAQLLTYDDPLVYLYTGRRGIAMPVLHWLIDGQNEKRLAAYFGTAPEFMREHGLDYVLATETDFHRDLLGMGRETFQSALARKDWFEPLFRAPGAEVYRLSDGAPSDRTRGGTWWASVRRSTPAIQ